MVNSMNFASLRAGVTIAYRGSFNIRSTQSLRVCLDISDARSPVPLTIHIAHAASMPETTAYTRSELYRNGARDNKRNRVRPTCVSSPIETQRRPDGRY